MTNKRLSNLFISWIGRIILGYQVYKYITNQINDAFVDLIVFVISIALMFNDIKWILQTAAKVFTNSKLETNSSKKEDNDSDFDKEDDGEGGGAIIPTKGF